MKQKQIPTITFLPDQTGTITKEEVDSKLKASTRKFFRGRVRGMSEKEK